MSDRTFRFSVQIIDQSTDKVLSNEFVSFDPLNTDEFGNNERVIMAVEAWLQGAKYDAQQMDLADEQGDDPDHFYKLLKSQDDCPCHVASAHDARVCARCGTHVEAA